MKKCLKTFALLGCMAILACGPAWAYVFEFGDSSTIDTSDTSDALWLNSVVINASLDAIALDLEVGQSSGPIYFATIGTTETWINSDDLQPAAVTAFVDFDTPDLTTPLDGTSVGFSSFWQFFQGWNLVWEEPVHIVTGSGLDFTVDLSDVFYSSWFWQGPDGTADIYADVTLNAVPIPTTLLLLASGLAGLVGMRRKLNT